MVPDEKVTGKVDEQLHPHFYQIKRAVRQQHRQSVFAYKMYATHFKEHMDMLRDMYGIADYNDLNDCFYIAVN